MKHQRLVEVACDESGSEGEKLIGGETDVFAHASVLIDTPTATACVREIRDRIRSPALEYKANHLLRKKNRAVLTWLLGPLGPIHGSARVHLTDKAFFVVGKVVDLIAGEVSYSTGIGLHQDPPTEAMAFTLHREGRRAFGPTQWEAFLLAFNNLMRAKNRQGEDDSVDAFFRMVDVLGRNDAVHDIMEQLRQTRPRVESFRAHLADGRRTIPALDPLTPAIVRAVVGWGAGRMPVSIVHDEQLSLTGERIDQLKEMVRPPHRLASLTLVDSREDSRIQVADFLAGVARKIASQELGDRGDAELTELLRPYVDPLSIWADDMPNLLRDRGNAPG